MEAWDFVDWMRTSDKEIFRWMYHRFEVTRDFHVNRDPKNKDKKGLDASDGGMAFTLVTGNYNGNLKLWSNLVRGGLTHLKDEDSLGSPNPLGDANEDPLTDK